VRADVSLEPSKLIAELKNELEYQKNHGIRPKIDALLEPEKNQIDRPSNEIQTTINQFDYDISLLQLPIHARHKLLLCVLMFHLNLVN
jgi:hypothetical protein